MSDWFAVTNVAEVPSPALLVYPDRIRENIERMISVAGGVERLCPHVKTHKLAEVTRLQLERGITKFKCATLAEAEMTARCGAADVLIAYPPVGPNLPRLLRLIQAVPTTRFSVIADDAGVLGDLSRAAVQAKLTVEVLLDLDVGMHRTGVAPEGGAFELYRQLASAPGLRAGGLHAYDGHLHDPDAEARARAADAAFAPVARLRERLTKAGFRVPRVVAGGTPTLPAHARRNQVECSPGTCLLWDAGYGTVLPDLDFKPAALVLTRVVSRPGGTRLCLDLGHKAIASEMPHPRVRFLNLADARAVMHNEEHLVIETDSADVPPVGSVLYGVPWHICPTVALHAEVGVVERGCVSGFWPVTARQRGLTV